MKLSEVMSCRCAGTLAALLLAVSAAPPALAAGPVWRDSAQLGLRVFEHSFQRVTANDVGCVVRVRLYFDAPATSYREPAAVRNQYHFIAEVRLSGGNQFLSEVFSNSEPGARVAAFSYDTAPEGCCVPQKFQ
jgi:hypothetical protein